ncbi:MAG: ABC transporter substrate-binding protein [Pseudomonadota bacterium]|nr:ABC transporter substrate-binding protein [Pseudomonadota bacterium]
MDRTRNAAGGDPSGRSRPDAKAPTHSRRSLIAAGGAALLLGVDGCASRSAPPSAALAPTGSLRASINLGNPILARRDPISGAAAGVSVDLAHALAAELGVPLELRIVDAAARSVEAVKSSQADVGFFAIDPLRGEGIRFSAPYLLIEGAYLVRDASPLTANDEVDRPGTRIVVGRGSAYDLHLSRALKSAELVRTPTSPKVVDEFLAQNADVAAGVKQQLEADAARVGGVRLLPGRFMVIEQAMGVPAGRGEAAQALLAAFVERAKASGFVAAALARHRIEGAVVAPPARP